jgi:hypothetical protein
MLEEQRHWFRIERLRPDSIMITVTLVGSRLEIDVFEDGHIEYSHFQGSESAEIDTERLFTFLQEQSEQNS